MERTGEEEGDDIIGNFLFSKLNALSWEKYIIQLRYKFSRTIAMAK